jgi:hypothetical protein
VFKDLRDLKRISDESDDPHGLPALVAGQGIGFVDFQIPPLRPSRICRSSRRYSCQACHALRSSSLPSLRLRRS